jgi:hypothetical protein
MKLMLTVLVALAVAGSALAAAPRSATLTIRHQQHGCHSWSFSGSSWKASQAITLRRGATLKVVDNDIMPHKLVQLSGPRATLTRPAMAHMGATATVRFLARGTYVFKTRAGEDYPMNMKMETVGEDNVLRLVVTVR